MRRRQRDQGNQHRRIGTHVSNDRLRHPIKKGRTYEQQRTQGTRLLSQIIT